MDPLLTTFTGTPDFLYRRPRSPALRRALGSGFVPAFLPPCVRRASGICNEAFEENVFGLGTPAQERAGRSRYPVAPCSRKDEHRNPKMSVAGGSSLFHRLENHRRVNYKDKGEVLVRKAHHPLEVVDGGRSLLTENVPDAEVRHQLGFGDGSAGNANGGETDLPARDIDAFWILQWGRRLISDVFT